MPSASMSANISMMTFVIRLDLGSPILLEPANELSRGQVSVFL